MVTGARASLAGTRSWAPWVLAVVFGAGCGDSLVGTDYQGDPLLTVQGAVSVLDIGRLGDQDKCKSARESCQGQVPPSAECLNLYDECLASQAAEAAPWESGDAELRVALFWSRSDDEDAGAEVVEQAVQATSGFPASYELVVYTPPSDAVVRTSDGGGFGLAVMLVYLDLDNDGVWDAGADRIVGGAAPAGVLYANEPWGDFDAGFHQVQVPRGCGEEGLNLSPADDALVDLRLSIAPTHLDGLLPDVDCDRSTVDWPMCPDREALLQECRVEGGHPPDPWRCTLCAGAPNGPPDSRDGPGGGDQGRPGRGGPPPGQPP